MRIAFAGVSSTGKSTLSKIIADKLGLPHIEEGLDAVYDMCEQRGRPLNIRDCRYLDAPSLCNFEYTMAEYIRESEEKHPGGFVTDSSAHVHLMYLYSRSHHMDIETFRRVEDIYRKQALRYDMVFHLPFGVIPIVDDNRRTTNPHFLKMESWVLDGILEGYDTYQVNARELERRVDVVSTKIAKLESLRLWKQGVLQ